MKNTKSVFSYLAVGFIAFVAAVLIVIGVVYVSFSGRETAVDDKNNESTEVRYNEISAINTGISESRQGGLVFGFGIDEFIGIYNENYKKDNNADYLTDYKSWRAETLERGVHSDGATDAYTFTEDEKVWSLPTISVYTPKESVSVQEISVNYDWHSHSDAIYSMYEKMCFYTLKSVLPKQSDKMIIDLYTKANNIGYENMRSVDEWYGIGSVPAVMFYSGNIGVYPYFAIGSMQHLCIVPVNESILHDFENKGVEICEIR